MNPELITLDKMLSFHDWYFDYSDDHSVWRRGQAQLDAINEEQRRLIHVVKVPFEEVMALNEKHRPQATN
jgi:hypothetical protein